MREFDHLPGGRRFGWYRAKAGGVFDISVLGDSLDEATWREFREFTRVVEWVRPYMVDWLALSADAASVAAAEGEIAADLSGAINSGSISVSVSVSAIANAQRRITSFLGAASAFRDRTAARLDREFGKPSRETAAFKTAMSFWFDRSFAYRCLYQLRNFAQHHELPITFVPIQADRDGGGALNARVAMHLYPATLADSDRINSSVRAELRKVPDDFLDVGRLSQEYMIAHSGLMATILDLYLPRLREMASYAAALYDALQVPNDVVPVVWEWANPSAGPQSKQRAVMMGFDEMWAALRLQEELQNRVAAELNSIRN